ncbi:hypothetical protein BaRGS_00011369 [Batillaria attramentaria]|uniref:Uncharacterized protein n=1 Tax=Batillaria attramentaria TaxID=370345 RepID=A0ABD0LD75_9CAEN
MNDTHLFHYNFLGTLLRPNWDCLGVLKHVWVTMSCISASCLIETVRRCQEPGCRPRTDQSIEHWKEEDPSFHQIHIFYYSSSRYRRKQGTGHQVCGWLGRNRTNSWQTSQNNKMAEPTDKR